MHAFVFWAANRLARENKLVVREDELKACVYAVLTAVPVPVSDHAPAVGSGVDLVTN